MYPGIGYGRRAVVSHFLRTGCRRRIGILEKKKKCIYFFFSFVFCHMLIEKINIFPVKKTGIVISTSFHISCSYSNLETTKMNVMQNILKRVGRWVLLYCTMD